MEIRSRMRYGTATFADTAEYNDRASSILGSVLSGRMPSTPNGERAKLCEYLLRHLYTDTNEMCAAVQLTLDKALGIQLAPQKAPFPASRVQAISGSLEDQTVPMETIQRRAGSAATVGRSFHDAYIKTNAEFRDRAGLQSSAIREGGAKCCDWCASVSGKYPASDTPQGFWGRHDNCKCSILYETKRGWRTHTGTGKAWQSRPAEDAGAPEPTRLTQEQAAEREARHPVISFSPEQAARVVAVQAGTMDYMSNSFRPKLSSSTETFHFNATKIPVYRVQNSDFQLYTDNPNPKAKATRTAEKLLRAALPFLPDGFEIPPVLVVDFNAHGLNLDSSGNRHDVIGGFVAELGAMFLNSQYDTPEKILEYVRRKDGQFANQTVLAPVLHELGHKYYEDCVKRLANSGGMSYNEAKQVINRAIFEHIENSGLSQAQYFETISFYALDGYLRGSMTEVTAECYTIRSTNNEAGELIKMLERDYYDAATNT